MDFEKEILMDYLTASFFNLNGEDDEYTIEMVCLRNTKDKEELYIPVIYPLISGKENEAEVENWFEPTAVEKINLYKIKYCKYILKYGRENIDETLLLNIPDTTIDDLFEILDLYNYKRLKEKMDIIREDLMKAVFHPKRLLPNQFFIYYFNLFITFFKNIIS